jgi:hypothetical protein
MGDFAHGAHVQSIGGFAGNGGDASAIFSEGGSALSALTDRIPISSCEGITGLLEAGWTG